MKLLSPKAEKRQGIDVFDRLRQKPIGWGEKVIGYFCKVFVIVIDTGNVRYQILNSSLSWEKGTLDHFEKQPKL